MRWIRTWSEDGWICDLQIAVGILRELAVRLKIQEEARRSERWTLGEEHTDTAWHGHDRAATVAAQRCCKRACAQVVCVRVAVGQRTCMNVGVGAF
ncbi:MAG: hypothetical protein ACPIOQ_57590 [Promethearchaeia archaeon]